MSTTLNGLLASGFITLTLVIGQALAVEDRVVDDLFERACTALEVDCSELDPPEIRYSTLFAQRGALGMWHPAWPDYIWLDVMFLDSHNHTEYMNGTILHEMVHYVDLVHKDEYDICEAESNAWRVENSYFVEIGKHEWANWNWREQYEDCAWN